MWIGSSRRVRVLPQFGPALLLVLASAASSAAQPPGQLPSQPTAREQLSLKTIPAPCELPAETLLRLEDRFRAILGAWARGADGAAELDGLWQTTVDSAARFEVTDATVRRLPAAPSGRVIVPAIGCQERAEANVLATVADRAPEAIPALFAFYLQVYSRQITPPPSRRWLASRARDRLLWLADLHKRTVEKGPEEKAARARLLLVLADVMRETPYHAEVLEARWLLGRVVDLLPSSVGPRYLAATLDERLGDYESAVRELRKLERRVPEDAEIQARLAVNRARLGDVKPAIESLRGVARGSGPTWIRIVAYQEWARLEAGRRRGDARAVLDEALERFPGEPQLVLQRSAHHVVAAEWRAAERLLASTTPVDPSLDARSPRMRYDVPRRDEIDAQAEALGEQVETGRAALARHLRER